MKNIARDKIAQLNEDVHLMENILLQLTLE